MTELRLPRKLPSELAHVVAAQFSQRVGHEFAYDTLPPEKVEVRVVHRLGGLGRELRRPRDPVVRQRLTDERGGCRRCFDRSRRDGSQHQPCFFDHPASAALHRSRHGEDRKVERAAPSQLPVGAAPAVETRQADAGENLVRSSRQVFDSIVSIEVADGDLSDTVDAGEHHRCAERQQRRGGIGGRYCQTLRTAGRDPADRAILLHAEINRFPPFVVLVVVIASGIQAEVAAERAHVAQMRRCHGRCGLPQRGIPLAEASLAYQPAERQSGAKCEAVAVRDLLELADASQAHERRWNLLAPLHVRQKIRPARHQHRVGRRRDQIRRLADRGRRMKREVGKAHHGRATSFHF